jgi:hypothetical protein
VSALQWEGERRIVIDPIPISYYYWWWWIRWCREFRIHGHVVCADGRPVPGAQVCAYDVDWFWWWWSKQQVGCATTDVNGSFDISFRWCCGFWPWWWWQNRPWEFAPEIAERIMPVIERDPRIELGQSQNVPGLEVFAPLLAREGGDISKPIASLPAARLESVRATLLEKLPRAPELEALHIWPWWPWWPWWDCTPDITFRVTQDCLLPGAVLLDEGFGQTRWDIPDPLSVTLVANDLACCRPDPPCNTGDCIDISAFCSDEGISLDAVGGNPGAPAGLPDGYGPGDRPFTGTIVVEKANDFTGVDYYEIETWDSGSASWVPLPTGACEDFCRHWFQYVFPFGSQNVPFKWVSTPDLSAVNHLVAESREHYTAWSISQNLVVPIDSTKFPDGTYRFRVVGWQDAGGGKIKNGHVLKVCDTEIDNEWVLTFDNRIYPDPTVLNCGSGFVHLCTKEPTTDIISVTIDGNPIPECGVTDINGLLEIEFEASDPDGHLAEYTLTLEWGASHSADMLGLGGASLTYVSGDGQGPTYAAALGQGHGAAVPFWHGGTMRFSVPATNAFTEPCCYLIRLEAVKRHYLGYATGGCGYNCNPDQYYNLSEFTVGAGVCDPRPILEVAASIGDAGLEGASTSAGGS